ncbi:MAG: hypothetical protein ACXW32_02930 [Limisphaerales bacterium]
MADAPEPDAAPQPTAGKGAERLFPFVVRARMLLVGRDTLARNKRSLQCILISEDISPNSKEEVMRDFKDYPILQRYQSAQFEQFFKVRNAKVVGFKKSSLAKSIYGELKEFRVNTPPPAPTDKSAAEQ